MRVESLEGRNLLAAVAPLPAEALAESPAPIVAASGTPSVELYSALTMSDRTTISGVVTAAPDTSYIVDLYGSASGTWFNVLSLRFETDEFGRFEFQAHPYYRVRPDYNVIGANLRDNSDTQYDWTEVEHLSRYVEGDANGDLAVDGADYANWADGFVLPPEKANYANGDFTSDRLVNGADYTVWADNFGRREAVWAGLSGGWWDTAGNWAYGHIPDEADHVVLPDMPNATIQIRTGDVHVRKITGGVKIQIRGNSSLSVDEDIQTTEEIEVREGTLRASTVLTPASIVVMAYGTIRHTTVTSPVDVTGLMLLGGTLDDVTLNTNARVSGGHLRNRVTINGTMMAPSELYCDGSESGVQLIDGDGKLQFSDDTFLVGRLIQTGDSDLELAVDSVFSRDGFWGNNQATMINRGRMSIEQRTQPNPPQVFFRLQQGIFRNEGEIDILDNGFFRIDDGTFIQAGTVRVTLGSTWWMEDHFELAAGSETMVEGQGRFGYLTNHGVLHVGSQGSVSMYGYFDQASDGQLTISAAKVDVIHSGQLTVLQDARLSGMLMLIFVDFVPTMDDIVTPLQYESLLGEFDSVESDLVDLEPLYGPQSLTIRVVALN